jgi:hypothetical protein
MFHTLAARANQALISSTRVLTSVYRALNSELLLAVSAPSSHGTHYNCFFGLSALLIDSQGVTHSLTRPGCDEVTDTRSVTCNNECGTVNVTECKWPTTVLVHWTRRTNWTVSGITKLLHFLLSLVTIATRARGGGSGGRGKKCIGSRVFGWHILQVSLPWRHADLLLSLRSPKCSWQKPRMQLRKVTWFRQANFIRRKELSCKITTKGYWHWTISEL